MKYVKVVTTMCLLAVLALLAITICEKMSLFDIQDSGSDRVPKIHVVTHENVDDFEFNLKYFSNRDDVEIISTELDEVGKYHQAYILYYEVN